MFNLDIQHRKFILSLVVYLGILWLYFGIPYIQAKPVTQVSLNANTIEITYPQYDYVSANKSFTLHYVAINSTKVLTTTTTSCLLTLYNPSGGIIYNRYSTFDAQDQHYLNSINENNFSVTGKHSFTILCNSTSEAGFVNGVFVVTNYGAEPAGDIFLVFIYSIVILSIVIALLLPFITIARFVLMETSIYDVVFNWCFYILLIISYFISRYYLLDSFLPEILDFFITLMLWLNGILPLMFLLITLIIKSFMKKRPLNTKELMSYRLQ
jgi:hypothetical protein